MGRLFLILEKEGKMRKRINDIHSQSHLEYEVVNNNNFLDSLLSTVGLAGLDGWMDLLLEYPVDCIGYPVSKFASLTSMEKSLSKSSFRTQPL